MEKEINNLSNRFIEGFKTSLPIAIGYFPVSFTFGIMATGLGFTPLVAIFISLTNFTSAGQFAGANLISIGASFLEIAITVFVINIRYMLMSFSLSQRIEKMSVWEKILLSLGITDETYALMATQKTKISFSNGFGMVTGPFLGWILGTACGAIFSSFLSDQLQNAMGIALYAMFISIIIPPSVKIRPVAIVVIIAAIISSAFYYLPYLSNITGGFVIIVSTFISCAIGAKFFPLEDAINDNN